MFGRTHYDILEVSPHASPEVIKAAYRSLMQRYHPDRTSVADSVRRAQEINDAYAVLSDPAKRRAYDAQREQDAVAGKRQTAPPPRAEPPPPPPADLRDSAPQWTKPLQPTREGAAAHSCEMPRGSKSRRDRWDTREWRDLPLL